jgi:hypothetical protein
MGCLFAVGMLALGASAARLHGMPDARPATASRPVGPTGVLLPAADPMAAEMQRELERGQREYADLFRRLALSQSEDEAFGIEEDMRRQRVELQVSLLRIQAAYARRAGRNAFADQLELAIGALVTAPPAPPSGPPSGRGL